MGRPMGEYFEVTWQTRVKWEKITDDRLDLED